MAERKQLRDVKLSEVEIGNTVQYGWILRKKGAHRFGTQV